MELEDIIVKKLFTLSKKASHKNEVPVAAIVIHNHKIIAAQFNKREHKHDVTAHAEVLAVRQAAKRLKRWNLADCDLYVTLKPCSMCTEVIKQCRMNHVYFLLEKPISKHEYSKTIFEKFGSSSVSDSYQQLLSSFFRNIR